MCYFYLEKRIRFVAAFAAAHPHSPVCDFSLSNLSPYSKILFFKISETALTFLVRRCTQPHTQSHVLLLNA